MYRKLLTIIVFVTLIPSVTMASATLESKIPNNHHSGFYVGGGLGIAIVASRNTQKDDGSFTGPIGLGFDTHAGYQFNPYFALEGELIGIQAIGAEVLLYGVTAKGILPLGQTFSLYAKAGVGAGSFRDCDGSCETASTSAILFGGGVTMAATQKIDVSLGYNGAYKHFDKGVATLGIVGLDLTYHF